MYTTKQENEMPENIKALVDLIMWVEARLSVERENRDRVDCFGKVKCSEYEWAEVRDHLQKRLLIVTKKECCKALGKSSLQILADNRKSIKTGE
jgi:hypothetical protein